MPCSKGKKSTLADRQKAAAEDAAIKAKRDKDLRKSTNSPSTRIIRKPMFNLKEVF